MLPSSIEQLILEYKYSLERHEIHKRMLVEFRDSWFGRRQQNLLKTIISFLEM